MKKAKKEHQTWIVRAGRKTELREATRAGRKPPETLTRDE